MKHWVIDRHGRVNLRIEEVGRPAPLPLPLPGERLVRVSAVALNAAI